MKVYYLPFFVPSDVDYITLLSFYEIAKFNENNRVYDTIEYTTQKRLAEILGLSPHTISQVFNSGKYKRYLSVDKEARIITLHNHFPKGTKQPFVRLTNSEVSLLREQKDNLFSQYFVYLKYYCGFSKDGTTDFTGKQFFSACGYSTKSNSYLNRLNKYNELLTDKQIIKIEPYRDELGHTRNRYSFL